MATGKWTEEFLESMRRETDPLADGVVAELFAQGGIGAVANLHQSLVAQDGVPQGGDVPKVLADYLEESARLPDWADPKITETGEKVLMSNGAIAFAILACASLPECYTDRRGIPVLWSTQQLNEHVHRRVWETAQFILDVLSPGGLRAGGKGILAAQKVRLMHATIRHLMLQAPEGEIDRLQTPGIAAVLLGHSWQEELGMPVNQEDLAFTQQTFAWVGVRSLRKLDAGLTAEQEEAVIHCWNVIGHIMGVRRDLQPRDVAEAELLFETIKARLAGVSPESQSMTAALLDFVEGMIELEHFKPLPAVLTRFLVGDETADLLAVPAPAPDESREARHWIEALEGFEHVTSDAFKLFSPTRKIAEWIFKTMLSKLFKMPRGWERKLFSLPQELASSWKIVDEEPI